MTVDMMYVWTVGFNGYMGMRYKVVAKDVNGAVEAAQSVHAASEGFGFDPEDDVIFIERGQKVDGVAS